MSNMGQVMEPARINIPDVITLTARLAQILAEEVDLLAAMKVSKLEALQNEKLFLINALEAQKKRLEKHPEFGDSIPSRDRRDLQEVVDIFNDILEENHRKLLAAKQVNHQIVQAITAVVKDNTRSRSYDSDATHNQSPFATLSVTLDKTV
jgi:flagellar biosynthesis/type III secretory pathway chaperone